MGSQADCSREATAAGDESREMTFNGAKARMSLNILTHQDGFRQLPFPSVTLLRVRRPVPVLPVRLVPVHPPNHEVPDKGVEWQNPENNEANPRVPSAQPGAKFFVADVVKAVAG